MPNVRETVTIATPATQVFDALADPKRATTFIPGLTRITNVSAGPSAKGTSWDYEFDWFGLVVSGRSECTAFDPGRRYQFQTRTGNPSTWTYDLREDAGRTSVSLDVEYELPENQVARFASRGAVEQMNRARAREIVDNLRALLED